jgi:alcohol dehydrogenase
MKAFVLSRYGGPDAMGMEDVARPAPKAGELLVRVKAAGLNPGDGVTGFAVGDKVFARTAKDEMGAFAQYATIAAHHAARIPEGVDFRTAAAVPLAGLTALQALRDELQLAEGSRVFITGGAGGVGTFAIQIAKWLGAEVITTASPRGKDLVERLGADTVIDYTSERFENRLSNVDGVFDLIGGETLQRAFKVTKKGGTVVSVAALPEPETARKDLGRGFGLATLFWFVSLPLRVRAALNGVRYRFLFMHPSGSELAELGQLIEQSRLEPMIDKVFPFDDIAEAFAYLERGHAKGKVVVEMAD